MTGVGEISMGGRVEGKVGLVTGAASGIGLATARRLSEEGAQVVLSDVAIEAGTQAAEDLSATFFSLDVSQENDWQIVVNDIVKQFGGLDLLVNNAGYAGPGQTNTPEDTPLDVWENIQAVNSRGVFLGCRAVIPTMAKGAGGSIVNISSIAALVQTWFNTPYGASKAAVRQLTQSVAVYCAQKRYRIRCNSVHPGQILTPMLEGLLEEDGGGTSVREEFLQKIPLGEFGEPEDVASAVLYLCSDEAKHVTGSQLLVDGGMYANL